MEFLRNVAFKLTPAPNRFILIARRSFLRRSRAGTLSSRSVQERAPCDEYRSSWWRFKLEASFLQNSFGIFGAFFFAQHGKVGTATMEIIVANYGISIFLIGTPVSDCGYHSRALDESFRLVQVSVSIAKVAIPLLRWATIFGSIWAPKIPKDFFWNGAS